MSADPTHPIVVIDSRIRFSPGQIYLFLHSLLLVGYALAGRSFAELGFSFLHVGDLVLLLGMAVSLTTGAWLCVPRTSPTAWLVLLMLWCAALAIQDLPAFGIDALRDSVVWGYGLFALLLSALINAAPVRLGWLLARYQRFGMFFVVMGPLVWLLRTVWVDSLPLVPGTDLPIFYPKPGEILVHLGGFVAFMVAGSSRHTLYWMLAVLPGFGLTAVRTRGGLLAFLAAASVVAVARPRARKLWIGTALAGVGLAMFLSVDTGIRLAGRDLSGAQLRTNLVSIFSDVRATSLDGPRRWRLEWWTEIVNYTVFGSYFWTGKGFGPNLATEDGFDLDPERRLRSPHNSHLVFLARSGVPGLILWCLVQGSWLLDMVRRYRKSRSAGERRWQQTFLFLIAYWLAFLVNASFDVSLEGPMMGIWFWTVFGVGLAAVRIHRRCPEVLEMGESR